MTLSVLVDPQRWNKVDSTKHARMSKTPKLTACKVEGVVLHGFTYLSILYTSKESQFVAMQLYMSLIPAVPASASVDPETERPETTELKFPAGHMEISMVASLHVKESRNA